MVNTVWLECWGAGWDWHDCKGVGPPSTNWGNITLSPVTKQRVELTWTANKHSKKITGRKFTGVSPQPSSEPSVDILSNYHPSQDPKFNREPPVRLAFDPVGRSSRNETSHQPLDTVIEEANKQPKYVAARVLSGTSLIIEDVSPRQVYHVQLQPHLGTNMTSVYFKLQENQSSEGWFEPDPGGGVPRTSFPRSGPAGSMVMRAEEIGLVILILSLWIVAILLFVHRWGKIRMLEPYQPEYKPITDPTTPPGSSLGGPAPTGQFSVPLSTYRGPPRKSSSLCFTPSMFQTLPSSYRGTLTHQQSTTSRASLPASSRHMSSISGRHRALRMRSDSVAHYTSRHAPASTHHSYYRHPFCRKARSAENLRNFRMSFNQSFDDPLEIHSSSSIGYGAGYSTKHGCSSTATKPDPDGPSTVTGVCVMTCGGAKHKWGRCINSSLENCRGGSLPASSLENRTPLLVETGNRGRSLDSACAGSARRLADGRVTPELRVSPPPPTPSEPISPRPHPNKVYFSYINKYSSPTAASSSSKEAGLARSSSSGCSHGRQFGLQRQDPIEETLFPPHYPTLVEEQEEEPTGPGSEDSAGGVPATKRSDAARDELGNVTTTTAIISSPPTESNVNSSGDNMWELNISGNETQQSYTNKDGSKHCIGKNSDAGNPSTLDTQV